jgi:hypothetical protein
MLGLVQSDLVDASLETILLLLLDGTSICNI